MTQKIFGDDMFCKYSPDKHQYEKKFNRAVFDIMVYYFSVPSIADGAKNKLAEIKKNLNISVLIINTSFPLYLQQQRACRQIIFDFLVGVTP